MLLLASTLENVEMRVVGERRLVLWTIQILWCGGVLAGACVKYISRSVCSQNPHTRRAARKTVVGAYVDVTDDEEDMKSSFSTHPYPEEYVRSRLFNSCERQKFAEAVILSG